MIAKSMFRGIVVAVIGTILLAACGSSSKSTTTTQATTPATQATTTTVAATTTTSGSKQALTVTPDTGLTNGQVVQVVGTGYPAGKTEGILECADKGTNTGQGDCDLKTIKTGTVTAAGTVTFSFAVEKGPFGGNNIVCSAAQKCLLDVNDLSATPTAEASMDISFAS
jgi:hypothetical protein